MVNSRPTSMYTRAVQPATLARRIALRAVFVCLALALSAAAAHAQNVEWLPVADAQPGQPLALGVQSSTDEGLELSASIPGVIASQVTGADGNAYTQLAVPGCGATAERAGLPEMPFRGFFLEVPHGVDVSAVVLETTFTSLGPGFTVYPLQPPQPDDEDEEPAFEIDQAAYAADAFVPAQPVVVGEPGIVRGRRVVFVQVFPVQYNPATTELRAIDSIRFAIRYQGDVDLAGQARKTRLATPQSEALAQRLILNYAPIDTGVGPAQQALSTTDAADYLIIVADSLYEEILPLAEWKHKKGFITRVVKMSQVGSSAADVRAYIQNAYDTWTPAPSYVLLVGDSADVPPDYYSGGYSCTSDQPYSCVDGSDYLPDLTIARLPVHAETDCTNVVNKILRYDRTPDGGAWYDDLLAAAYFQDGGGNNVADRWFMETAMTIYDFLVNERGWDGHTALCTDYWPLGTSTFHFRSDSYPHRPDVNQIRWGASPYPDPVPAWIINAFTSSAQATADVTSAINAGVGIVQHRDHGGETSWGDPPYNISNINSLTNGIRTPVVFSLNCLTGSFHSGECFCEAFIKKNPGGCVGIVGATRTSYSGHNDLLAHGIYTCFWPSYDTSHTTATYPHSWRPAEALVYGKYYMYVYEGGGDLTGGEFNMFHWFGDPEMPLRTKTPQPLIVTHPPTVVFDTPIDVTINVAQGGVPFANALVCISHPTAPEHWRGFTDGTGSITFTGITFPLQDDYDVVVTETNSIPYEGVISATLSSEGFVQLDRDAYSGADTVTMTVGDLDLVGAGSQLVTISTTGGDTETVTLTETGPSTGLFIGTIGTATGSVSSGNGTLEVAHGDTITLAYEDLVHGTAGTVTVTDTAVADCQGPLISAPIVTNIEDLTATIMFDTDEVAFATVRYGLAGGPLTHELTNPAAGTAHAFDLAGLTANTAYIFEVETNDLVGNVTLDNNGGVYHTFTTDLGPLGEFEVAAVPSPQYTNCPFEVSITAKDIYGNTKTSYNSTIDLGGWLGTGPNSTIVITEIDYGTPDTIELINVAYTPVDISGWVIYVYDIDSWPDFISDVTIPAGTTVPAGAVFLLEEYGTAPGAYPHFYTGDNIDWTSSTTEIGVLLCDDTGDIVDFATVDNSTQITAPCTIPPEQWSGAGISTSGSGTYQRIGDTDNNVATDWHEVSATLGSANLGLSVPFTPGADPVAITPTSITFAGGHWVGNVSVLAPAAEMYLRVDDGAGHIGDSNTFDTEPGIPITVTLPAEATEGDGTLVGAGRLDVPVAPSSDLTVTLLSDDTSELTAPATVVISAGETFATFDLTVQDDALFDGTQTPTLTASAADPYVPGHCTMAIHDNEVNTLSVTVPVEATEGDGTLPAAGTVGIASPAAGDVIVTLSSDDTSEVTVPATVIIPDGATSAAFDITIIDDGAIDFTQTAAITAAVTNWIGSSDAIDVHDNETTDLVVALAPPQWENAGLLPAAGTVSISGIWPVDLVVDLASGDTSELTVPATVTIPAGATAAPFDLTVVDDTDQDGAQEPVVTASAVGFIDGTQTLTVLDDDLHHYAFGPIGVLRPASVPFTITIAALNIDDDPIEPYTAPCNLSATGDSGPLPIDPITSGAFTGGVWTGNVTISAVDTGIRITADDGAGNTGTSGLFNTVPGPLDHFAWSTIASPQYTNAPFTATVTAQDANNHTVTSFIGAATLEGWIGTGPNSSIVITECGDDTPDFVEIQNVSGTTINTDGWIVALNDAENSNINTAHSVVWELPSTMAPGEVLFRTDDTGLNYFGSNIWWGSATDVGWAMILDADYNIADFVVWGYSVSQIVGMNTTINGHSVTVGDAWTGAAITYVNTDDSFQRQGDTDNNTLADWTTRTISRGTQNTGLTVPFAPGAEPVAITPTSVTFTDGVWSGPVTILEEAEGMYLRAIDGAGHLGQSNTFNVEPGIPLTVTLPAEAAEGDGVLSGQGRVDVAVAPGTDLAVTLSSDDTSELTVPATVVILAGQTFATFDLTVEDDADFDGTQTATITASAVEPYVAGHAAMIVHDNDVNTLIVSVPAEATEGDGFLAAAGTVSVTSPVTGDVTVALSSNDTTEATVPATLVIQDGTTSATFDITIVDDNAIDFTQTATITAIVTNWTAGGDAIDVHDNETLDIVVALPPPQWESAGALANAGTVSISGTWPVDLVINLASDDTSELTVPATVTIPAGATAAPFDLTVVDDTDQDGAQTATVTASAAGFIDGTQTLTVLDDDLHHYAFSSITSPQIAGVPFAATITAVNIDDETIEPYTDHCNLSAAGASGPLPIVPPASGAFSSGVWTGNVAVDAVDTGVRITADDGAGHTGTSNLFDTVPGPLDHFAWDTIPSPQYTDAPFAVTITAQDANDHTVTGFTSTVALSGPPETVEILSFVKYADIDQEYLRTLDAIASHFTDFHETNTTTTDPVALAVELVGKNVFLVPEQEAAPAGTMGPLGTAWAAVLNDFVNGGGVVIICSHLKDEHLILHNSALMDLTKLGDDHPAQVTVETPHLLTTGVVTPFEGQYISLYSTTNGTVALKRVTGGEGVVLCRDVGAGHVVAVGTDFFTTGTGMDRIIANAVEWAQGVPLNISPPVSGNFVNGQWSGDVAALETATTTYLRADDGAGHIGNSNTFDVEPGIPITVTLPAQAAEGSGTLPGAGRVDVPVAPSSDLTVSLASDDTSELTVPATVVIGAGLTFATFDLIVEDDADFDGTQSATVTASAATPYVAGNAAITVHDNDVNTLTVSAPADAAEGDGLLAGVGTVSVSSPVTGDVTVALSSDDTTEATVPATVIILDGTTSVAFDITIIDDNAIDFTQTATITATVTNWTTGSDAIDVHDNETTDIVVALPPPQWENAGLLGNAGTVSISGTWPVDLVIDLASDDTTELTVPAAVTIPAGSTSAPFDLTVVDDTDQDGAQTATVTAVAVGFVNGTQTLTVLDDDLHHYAFSSIASPRIAGVPFAVTIAAENIDDETIEPYTASCSLSAAGAGGPLPVDPVASGTFSSGVWTGNVAVNAVDTGVRITADDGAGHTGTSNLFDTVPGPLDHFAWDTIPSPQYMNAPFAVTITAQDANNHTVTGFTGTVGINGTPDTVEILSFVAYADLTREYPNTLTAISTYVTNYNATTTTTTDPATLATELAGKNVFLIPEQENASSGSLGTYGTAWTAVLTDFVNAGGTIIVCSHLQDEHLILHNSGLLDVTKLGDANPAQVTVETPHLLTAGVTTPFEGQYISLYSTTNGTVALKRVSGNEAVVLCRDVGAGHVVIVGTDFYTTGTGMDRIIANAVAWDQSTGLPVTPSVTGNFVDGQWSGDVTALETAAATRLRAIDDAGHIGLSNAFDIEPGIPVNVTLPPQATEGDGTLLGQGMVDTAVAPATDLVVFLSSDDTTELTVPASIIIPAGHTSAAFDITIEDDADFDATQTATVTAEAAVPYVPGHAAMNVLDNDVNILTVSVPAGATEGDGVLAGAGLVTVTYAVSGNIVVALSSDDTTEATVPASVTIPDGAMSAAFDITILDDTAIDSTQTATIAATVTNWTAGGDAIDVHDNETTDIVLTLAPPQWENAGLLVAAGTVSISGTWPVDLVIDLASDDTSELTVPATVTIPSGATAAPFDLTVVDDTDQDGAQTATVTAVAAGFVNGTQTLTVLDDDLHHFAFSSIASPRTVSVPFPVTVMAKSVDGETIEPYAGSCSLSAAGAGGPLPMDPAPFNAFTAGVCTGNVAINAIDTGVRLTADDGAGITGTSNVFDVVAGPVDHFVLSSVASPQVRHIPFSLTVTAKDAHGFTATGFVDTVNLTGWTGSNPAPTVLVSEIDPNAPDAVEFTNVCGHAVDISNWTITIYDVNTWPEPRASITIPASTTVGPDEVFTIEENGTPPGAYPTFYAGVNIGWTPAEVAVAVLLQDNTGAIVDFATVGDSTTITNPLPITAAQWNGPGIPAGGPNYLRIGISDDNNNSNWTGDAGSMGTINTGLTVPFLPGTAPVAVAPTVSGNFVDGVWTGNVRVLDAADNVSVAADDGAGHDGSTNIFDVLEAPDTDSDGMPDSWELANGLDPNDPTDATLDADGDGLLNIEEFEFGSDPQDPNSPDFIYVDDDAAGNPVQDGTLAHPYESIQTAVDAAALAAPAVVKVMPGTYAEFVTMADRVWLIGSGNGSTTIAPPAAGPAVFLDGVEDALLAAFTLAADATSPQIRSWYSYVTVRDCVLARARNSAGVNFTGSMRLVNCLMADNVQYGLWVSGTVTVEMINCTVANNGECGAGFYGSNVAHLVNTIFHGNLDDLDIAATAVVTAEHCDIGDGDFAGANGNIAADPLFVDPVAGDYRTLPGSPCIDAGTSNGAPTLDLLSTLRWDAPSAANTGAGLLPWYDIGAYEYAFDCDVDGDFDIDIDDLLLVYEALGSGVYDPALDIDRDGAVTFADLRLVYEHIPPEEKDFGGVSTLWVLDFMAPTNPGAQGLDPHQNQASLDNDADGRTNYEEFVAGTDPTDPASLFHVTAVTSAPAAGLDLVSVSWSVVPGKSYQLYCAQTPGPNADWHPVDGTYQVVDGIATQQFEVDPTKKALFFRVQVW